jgi:hypothetical protein
MTRRASDDCRRSTSGRANFSTINRDRLIGVWKLNSIEVRVDGNTVYPYGENPIGRLTYDTDGRTPWSCPRN